MIQDPIKDVAAKAFNRAAKTDGPASSDLEVKPVAPIQADTPEQVIERLRKELSEERAKRIGSDMALDNALEDRERMCVAKDAAQKAFGQIQKRIGEVSSDRDRWQTKAKQLETQVDAQKAEKIVAMIDERQKLRTDLGQRDKLIADLSRKVTDAQDRVASFRQATVRAEQRAQGFEASLEAMQVARDKAQSERADADGILAEIRRVLQLLGVDVEKTPPMFYPEAIKAQYGAWTKRATALETQVHSLLAKLPKPVAVAQGVSNSSFDGKLLPGGKAV